MLNIPTPHINAKAGDFAKTVLMPGDPLRAKFIAETFLTDVQHVNTVRGINGYTGFYKGKRVSVMASGMGMPSMGIYSYELYTAYGVENIIRVGTAGGLTEAMKIRDVVIGMGACTNSNFVAQYNLPGNYAPICSYSLLRRAVEVADNTPGMNYHVGNLLSSDTFYNDTPNTLDWTKMGVMAVEMEAAALYMNAARLGKNALAICTISDNLVTEEATSAEERQVSFKAMMELALEVAPE